MYSMSYISMFISLVIISFCSAVINAFLLDGEIGEDPVVSTSCGLVRGINSSDGVYTFKGIPYAHPPTGQLRWKLPQPLSLSSQSCWRGIYNATTFSTSCFQPNVGTFKAFHGSEDCLYLNVWTPTLDPHANLPVLVWIHGGFLLFGSGTSPLYGPTEALARETNIVYASMNYRLNAFGFMALDLLSAEAHTNTSGNYGFWDQILAIEWIKNNIRQFGGDPNSMTVYGQSSGGTSIFALLASPLAKNLFQRAWLLSASPVLNKTLADASRDNLAFLNKTNCSDVDCLRKMTPTQISSSIPWFEYPYWAMEDQSDLPEKNYFDGAVAIVDGVVLPKAPFEAWRNGEGNDVPTIIGTTAQETDLAPSPPNIDTWTWTDYTNHVQKKLGTFGADIAKQALDLYPVNHSVTPEYQFTSMSSDLRVTCPNNIMAAKMAQSFDSNVWRYVVTSSPSVPIHLHELPSPSKYAFHSWDFIAFSGLIPHYIKSPTSNDVGFQETMRREILSFVRTGEVNDTLWRRYPNITAGLSGSTQILSNGFNPERCNFWTKNNFFSYAWIN